MSGQPKATDLVGSHFDEAIKSFSIYDGSNRLSEFFVALAETKDGEKCMKTTYTYDGVTTRVLKTKEELADWQAAWDI
jgi:hypothetical protein